MVLSVSGFASPASSWPSSECAKVELSVVGEVAEVVVDVATALSGPCAVDGRELL